MRTLLAILAPALGGIITLAIAGYLAALVYAWVVGIAIVAYWKARPRHEMDEKKFPTDQRRNQIIEDLKEARKPEENVQS